MVLSWVGIVLTWTLPLPDPSSTDVPRVPVTSRTPAVQRTNAQAPVMPRTQGQGARAVPPGLPPHCVVTDDGVVQKGEAWGPSRSVGTYGIRVETAEGTVTWLVTV